MLLVVHGRTNNGILSSDGAFDPDMREALANAAQRYDLAILNNRSLRMTAGGSIVI
jgi:hypothetical protein